MRLADAGGREIGMLVRFVDEPIHVTRAVVDWGELPSGLVQRLERIDRLTGQVATTEPATRYVLAGPALEETVWVRAHIHR